MTSPDAAARLPRPRDVAMFRSPQLWLTWPFLPVIRDAPGGGRQLGVLYDAFHATGRCGYTATVWLTNIFLLPDDEEALLALPHVAYDTVEEMAADGWTVD
jgi:hypothetical protein